MKQRASLDGWRYGLSIYGDIEKFIRELGWKLRTTLNILALIDRAKDWLLKFPEIHWSEKERKFTWYDTSKGYKRKLGTLQFGYLESENDKYNYQGKFLAY